MGPLLPSRLPLCGDVRPSVMREAACSAPPARLPFLSWAHLVRSLAPAAPPASSAPRPREALPLSWLTRPLVRGGSAVLVTPKWLVRGARTRDVSLTLLSLLRRRRALAFRVASCQEAAIPHLPTTTRLARPPFACDSWILAWRAHSRPLSCLRSVTHRQRAGAHVLLLAPK